VFEKQNNYVYLIQIVLIFNHVNADVYVVRLSQMIDSIVLIDSMLHRGLRLNYQCWMRFRCHFVAKTDRWLVAMTCWRYARASAWSSSGSPTLCLSTLESHQRRRWRQDALRHIVLPRFALPFVFTRFKGALFSSHLNLSHPWKKTIRWMGIYRLLLYRLFS